MQKLGGGQCHVLRIVGESRTKNNIEEGKRLHDPVLCLIGLRVD
jgi:hypothetical protein